MYIFYSNVSDPMILDSVENLNALHDALVRFLESEEGRLKVEETTSGSPEPYDELLAYIEARKAEGKISVALSNERGLVISGATEHLSKYVEAFEFGADEDGNHHHPEFTLVNKDGFEMNGLWPFVEADNDYVTDRG